MYVCVWGGIDAWKIVEMEMKYENLLKEKSHTYVGNMRVLKRNSYPMRVCVNLKLKEENMQELKQKLQVPWDCIHLCIDTKYKILTDCVFVCVFLNVYLKQKESMNVFKIIEKWNQTIHIFKKRTWFFWQEKGKYMHFERWLKMI